ncbi:DNA double-strand break repair nuclease NurA [Candidatus Micrarchaeota archaeon]|nr:DNA double-strand break repair nuclease NurA [Candidatus Micrarchaeota archaeon]
MINEEAIQRAVHDIRETESRLQSFASHLKKNSPEFGANDLLDSKLMVPVVDSEVNGSISAVDGGLLAEELHSLDLLLVRSAAVVFKYEHSKLKSYSFIPSGFPPYDVFTPAALDTHEFAWFKNLKRLNSEISRALEIVKIHSVDALFLDGSIVPQLSDKPPHDSPLYADYRLLVKQLLELYAVCEEKNCMLLGIIKDSKGKHFLSLLKRELSLPAAQTQILERTNDTAFIFTLLEPKQRTFAFRYSALPEHPILKDLGVFRERICSVYLKAVKYDRPLRIDFLLPQQETKHPLSFVNRLTSLVYSLSKHNPKYAYPPVLIEADLRAAMHPKEMDLVYKRVASSLGFQPSIFKLRRHSRPFR